MTTADPHRHTPLARSGPPLTAASYVLLCLHGRGAEAADALALGAAIAPPGSLVLAPQAAGRTWYPLSFLAPREHNEPFLSSALDRVRRILDEVRDAGVPRDRIAITGFSQGACLTCEFIATHPEAASLAVVLTGGLIGREISEAAPGITTRPCRVHLTTGDPDPHVPRERVEASAARLTAQGHNVSVAIYPGRPHRVSDPEFRDARELVRHQLAPDAEPHSPST